MFVANPELDIYAREQTLGAVLSALQGTLQVEGDLGNFDAAGLAEQVTLEQVRVLLSNPLTLLGNLTVVDGAPELRAAAPRLQISGEINTVGDTVILAAPAVGTQYVLSEVIIQNASGVQTTVLLEAGVGDADPMRIQTLAVGDGHSRAYTESNAIRLGDNTALVLNLSSAETVSYTFRYWIENTTTGEPV